MIEYVRIEIYSLGFEARTRSIDFRPLTNYAYSKVGQRVGIHRKQLDRDADCDSDDG